MKRLRRAPSQSGLAYNAVPFGRYSIFLLLAGTAVYLLFILAKMNVQVFSSQYTLTATVADAGGLSTRDRPTVLINGVQAGHMTDLKVKDGAAVAKLAMNKETKGLVHDNATIRIEPRSGLQDLALNIWPGSPAAPELKDGDSISQANTRSYVAIDDVTNVVDADTRAYVQALLGELNVGLAGKGAPGLRQGLRQLPSVVERTSEVTSVLAERRRLLAQLVTESDAIFSTLGDHAQQLSDVTQFGTQTVRVVADREAQLAQAVKVLPSTLDAARGGLTALHSLSQPLVPALTKLRPAVVALGPAAKNLNSFIPSGQRLTDSLRTFVNKAPAGAESLRVVGERLAPAARTLEPLSRRLPGVVDIANDLFEPGNNVANLLANVSGVFSTNDANSPVTRGGVAAYEPPTPENFGFPASMSARRSEAMNRQIGLALNLTCLVINKFACNPRGGLEQAAEAVQKP